MAYYHPSVKRDTVVTGRDTIDLGCGFEAVPVYLIRKRGQLSAVEKGQLASKSTRWKPKSSGYGNFDRQWQRCPYITVDTLTFCKDPTTREICILLGLFNKEVNISGQMVRVKGAVFVGGGHYEISGDRPHVMEPGHTSLDHAANTELFEEAKLGRPVLERDIGFIDYALQEPRHHVLRYIRAVYVEQDPGASDELREIYRVPLSQLNDVMDGRGSLTTSSGEEISMELGHDWVLQQVGKLPGYTRFLQEIMGVVGMTASHRVSTPSHTIFQ